MFNTLETKNKAHTFFADDRGAVDMPSTIVTVVLIMALFGAIAVSVFQVVPWAQNAIIKHNVETVASAQEHYATQLEAGIISNGLDYEDSHSYATEAQLLASGIIASMPNGVTTSITGDADVTKTDDGFTVTATLKNGQAYTVTGGN